MGYMDENPGPGQDAHRIGPLIEAVEKDRLNPDDKTRVIKMIVEAQQPATPALFPPPLGLGGQEGLGPPRYTKWKIYSPMVKAIRGLISPAIPITGQYQGRQA